MTPLPSIRPACGPADSLCFDQDSGGELVPRGWADDPQDGAPAPIDDFHSVERSEVPTLERCVQRRAGGRSWCSWAGLSPQPGASPRQLARAHAARAMADGGDGEGEAWSRVVVFCLSERLDLSETLAAVPWRGDPKLTLPGRLLQARRLEALRLLVPQLRRGAWGEHACLPWRGGCYFGGAAAGQPEGDGLWCDGDGHVWVHGAWRLGRAVGGCSWRRGELRWQGPVDGALARHGAGRLTLPDGGYVNGSWEGGRLVGDALVRWPDGRRYYGPVRHEWPPLPHGRGRCDGADGTRTEGCFDHGILIGIGTYTFPRGAPLHGWRYRGPFRAGRKHGQGHLEPTACGPARAGRARHLAAVYDHDRLLANSPAGQALAQLMTVGPGPPQKRV